MFKVILAVLMVAWVLGQQGCVFPTNANPITSEYAKCRNSKETAIAVDYYQKQYPNLSRSQLGHSLCSK
jgi:hypothetical protein